MLGEQAELIEALEAEVRRHTCLLACLHTCLLPLLLLRLRLRLLLLLRLSPLPVLLLLPLPPLRAGTNWQTPWPLAMHRWRC